MTFLEDIAAEVLNSIRDPSYLEGLPEPPGRRPPSFRAAIETGRLTGALVVEHKRVSPGSENPNLPIRSIPQFVASVAPANPAAFSCLATGPRFQGSPRDVCELVANTDRPVLFKDFVLDPIQLEAAQRAGASAVLLIARLEREDLTPVPIAQLAETARRHRLEVLLEFHEEADLGIAPDVRADVYGVNLRDLASLEIRRSIGLSTLRAAQAFRPLLGLSGVRGPADAAECWNSGADGLLVGSSAARASDPAAFLRTLYRSVSGSPP
jgi:indole-3-glycerol phosphate synthase